MNRCRQAHLATRDGTPEPQPWALTAWTGQQAEFTHLLRELERVECNLSVCLVSAAHRAIDLTNVLCRSPPRWQWRTTNIPVSGPARLTVLPHEAVLLNSLRRLLLVVPHTERTISKWAGGPIPQVPPTPTPTNGSVIPPSPMIPTGVLCWTQ